MLYVLVEQERHLLLQPPHQALIDRQPVAQRICRIYARDRQYQAALAAALQQLAGHGEDDLTNM